MEPLSIVIPTFNEAETIGGVIDEIPASIGSTSSSPAATAPTEGRRSQTWEARVLLRLRTALINKKVRSGEIERYTSLAQVTHWAAAALMLTAVVLAWVFMAMPADQAGRFAYITLHKSIGQTIFFLTFFRLIWRHFHPAPRMGGRIAMWETIIAKANHWLLYAIMIIMPLTGYVLATAAARPSPYFWLFYWPQPAVSPMVAHAALRAHLVGQYLVYAMAGLHLAAVVWHVAIRRDATLERMLPAQGRA